MNKIQAGERVTAGKEEMDLMNEIDDTFFDDVVSIYNEDSTGPEDKYTVYVKINPGGESSGEEQRSLDKWFDRPMGEGQGGPGSYDYKTVKTEKEAEKLQADGWKLIDSGKDRFQMERPKQKPNEAAGDRKDYGVCKYCGHVIYKAHGQMRCMCDKAEPRDRKSDKDDFKSQFGKKD
jgi:hypothetical protein